MDKEEIHSRVGQEIRSCHRYAFRSGQWALIKSVSKHSGGDDMWLLEWPDGVTDVWVPWDEVAEYEFRDNRDELVNLLQEELDDQDLAEHIAEVLREAGYEKAVKDEKKEASLEDLEAAPVGARAVTADERVIEKSEDGWTVVGFIYTYEVPNHKNYETASAETAMNLSPLYMIGEIK